MALNLNNDMNYTAGRPKDYDYLIDELIEDAGSLKFAVGKNGSKIWKFIFTFGEKRKKLFWRLSHTTGGDVVAASRNGLLVHPLQSYSVKNWNTRLGY